MVLHGKVHGGVVVLENGGHLPEGARVTIIPEVGAESHQPDSVELSQVEHARILSMIDRIATLPIEGTTDPFSGDDHDRALYGAP